MARRRRRPTPTEKKRVPVATYVWGGIGALALLRGLWNANRAVVKAGEAADCPGPVSGGGCSTTILIAAAEGTPVYSVGGGRIVSVGPNWVHVEVKNEPVILYYGGLKPSVRDGAYAWRGGKLGTVPSSKQIEFGVWEVTKDGVVPLEPSSWLAARGYRLAVKQTGKGDAWCEQKRKIVVPKSAHQTCKLGMPEAAGFALLPVSITQE